MKQIEKIAIGLGSNVEPRLDFLKRAYSELALEFLDEPKCSSVYESSPWGPIPNQAAFLNLVVVGLSEWKPPAILNYIKSLEHKLGRVETKKYGPRQIDLDLLVYGQKQWNDENLVVPHPEMFQRDFVLWPLAEIWPGCRLRPDSAITVSQLAKELGTPLGARPVAGPFQL